MIGIIFLFIQSVLSATSMSEETIIALFEHVSESSKSFLLQLVKESFRQLGPEGSLGLLDEWTILSTSLNTSCKLSCLRDANHRTLILEFLKAEATSYYKNSYFNHAKIDKEYLKYLKQIGPYEFTEILTIVNKLKLIERHHRTKMETRIVSENHIDEKIRKIMEICHSDKRSVNSTLNKFKAIVEFQDRIQLIKELGKLLRQSWSSEKKYIKNEGPAQEEAKPRVLVNQEKELSFQLNVKEYFKEADKTGIQSFFPEQLDFL